MKLQEQGPCEINWPKPRKSKCAFQFPAAVRLKILDYKLSLTYHPTIIIIGSFEIPAILIIPYFARQEINTYKG